MGKIKNNAKLHGKVVQSIGIEENEAFFVLKNGEKITVFVADIAGRPLKTNVKLTAFQATVIRDNLTAHVALEEVLEGRVNGVGMSEIGQATRLAIQIGLYHVIFNWYAPAVDFAYLGCRAE